MRPAIIVHGGAGPIHLQDQASFLQDQCMRAARAGYARLTAGDSALDAVESAVRVLEDAPEFNAGTGACLNSDGRAELDAAIMDGATLMAGAVALVDCVKNPIRLARKVMETTPHVFLAGPGAVAFATRSGIELCDPGTLVTEGARQQLQAWRLLPRPGTGTVGAVAIDADGHVAAATSTGGTTGKQPGRIGDSPLIGAGTYAADGAGAVSVTGYGEPVIRVVLAKFASDAMRAGQQATSAVVSALEELKRVDGSGGLIAVDSAGRLGWAMNTERMTRAWINGDGTSGAGFT